MDPQFGQRLSDGLHEALLDGHHGRVEIGGVQAPGKIQGAAHAVAHGKVGEIVGDELGDAAFVQRVAHGEFRHHTHTAHPPVPEFTGYLADLLLPDGNVFPPTVVDGTVDEIEVVAQKVVPRVDSRAGGDDHTRRRIVLHDNGVGGQGGGEYHPLDLPIRHPEVLDDAQDGSHQVIRGYDLGQGDDLPFVEADRIRMCAADIYSANHTHPSIMASAYTMCEAPGRTSREKIQSWV